MAFMQWDERFRLNVETMDAEHQQLIRLMNRLHEEHLTGGRDSQKRALTALGEFTKQHFADEERYMLSVDYPGYESHKRHHEKLLERFTEHAQAFEGGAPLGTKFFEFLRFWLSAHICGIDTKYAEHAQEKQLPRTREIARR